MQPHKEVQTMAGFNYQDLKQKIKDTVTGIPGYA